MTAFDLVDQLNAQRQAGLYRSRRIIDSAQGVALTVDGQRVVNFCSNDYLGLANHSAVVAALSAGATQYGVGSGSAHLVCGHSRVHQQLEHALAEFTGRDRAVLFSTGYMANIGCIGALVGAGDAIFEDRLNHASLLDGARLSGARFKRYHHGDPTHLQRFLAASSGVRKLVVTDGVFSMDGDLAPLPELVRVAQHQAAWVMVDDAHGLGVLGAQGQGVVEHYHLSQEDVPVLIGTLGKSFGTAGAFVAGSESLIETVIQKARSYIYTTALPPALAAATLVSLQLLVNDDWRRERLQDRIQQFRSGARQLGLPLTDSTTAIQPVLVGDSHQAMRLSDALLAENIWVSAIRPPTVPLGGARLRITFSALHEAHHVDRLLCVLDKAWGQLS